MRVAAAEPCRTFAAGIFRALGADEDIAGEVAAHLVRANLSGHVSRGIIRIIQYVREADRGELDPGARPAGPGVGSVTPYGGATRFFGTNPWSDARPG